VYAFVEGEPDVTFYRLYVQKYAGGQRDVYIYNCEGKRNVYSAYGDIVSRYPDCRRVLFFVDKDIDEIIGLHWPTDPRVFVTEHYSIENYIVTKDALARYFEDFVKIRRVDVDLRPALEAFDHRIGEFYKLILPIMAWIVTMRRAGNRVLLSGVNLSALFSVTDKGTARIPARLSLRYLSRVTEASSPRPIWKHVRAVCVELKRMPAKAYVRGKFEAWWFIEFGRRVEAGLHQVAREVGGSVSPSMPLNGATFVQLLAPYMPIPASLDAFLRFHLMRPLARADVPPQSRGGRIWSRLVSFLRPK